MKYLLKPLLTAASVVLSASNAVALSSKDIVVDLKAEWDAIPFQNELVEAISAQNPEAYYPLLLQLTSDDDDGHGNPSHKQLYESAIQFALKENFISESAVPFIDLDLSLHKHSAKIQAFYQYHDTVAAPESNLVSSNNMDKANSQCPVWIHYNGKTSCDSGTVFALETKSSGKDDDKFILPHDRVFGSDSTAPLVILYADISNPSFGLFHKHLYHSAESGKIRYVLRYRKPVTTEKYPSEKQELAGYGVELYIKRTDYLVIDDRDVKSDSNSGEAKNPKGKKELKPLVDEAATLSKKNIPMLGFKAASYIMENEDKFDSLANVSLDFPKYSFSLSELTPNKSIQKEITKSGIQPGANILYINGAPIAKLDDNIFSLTNIIGRERQYMSLFEEFGIKASDAIKLISYSGVDNEKFGDDSSETDDDDEISDSADRYDYRSPAIIWLNDLAQDPQYSRWSTSLSEFLNPLKNGQLHSVAHNAHTLVFTFSPSNPYHFQAIRDLFALLQRNIPIQIGLLPIVTDEISKTVAEEMYSLYENGDNRRQIVMYLVNILQGSDHETAFANSMNSGKYSSFKDVVKDESIQELISANKKLVENLDLTKAISGNPTMIANGIFVSSGNNWFHDMLKILQEDTETIRKKLDQGVIDIDDDSIILKDELLKNAATRRNSLVTTDTSEVEYTSAQELYDALWKSDVDAQENHVISFVRDRLPSNVEDPDFVSTVWVAGISNTADFLNQVLQALTFIQKSTTTVRLNIVPATSPSSSRSDQSKSKSVNQILYYLASQGADSAFAYETLQNVYISLYGTPEEKKDTPTLSEIESNLAPEVGTNQIHYDQNYDIISNLKNSQLKKLVDSDVSIFSAGRVIAIPTGYTFSVEDLQLLQNFELKSHVKNIIKFVKGHGVTIPRPEGKDHGSFNFVDKLVSLVSNVKFSYNTKKTAVGKQIFPRVGLENWDLPHSSFEVGSKEDSNIHIVAVIDPLSERGQVYTSYLKSLIEIPNFWVKVILNPTPGLEDIPLKRFYRSSFPVKPVFNEKGQIESDSGNVVLSNMPQSTLMSMDLDVPSAWISMPKSSIYDLDNIILDKVEEEDLEATYELKYILVEGHATDITLRQPPRGVQLNLGTEAHPDITDTIVMENLGYLQLKAGPGLWRITLKEGLSSEIFEILDMGLSDDSPVSSDPSHVWVTDFTGTLVLPKFVRRKGMESKDVLGEGTGLGKPSSRFTRGQNAQKEPIQQVFDIVENTGKNLKNKFGSFLSRFGSSSSNAVVESKPNAEINIFSVASGHLYERFLSIMTLSVMEHTNKTVKFWIIENFLSPKFKDFLPHLAKEQGFEYELVTYKWPHWLRAQTEKQRTIWGYKILFLDVLFPQSLDKIIFVDADQIVRTDMKELVDLDLEGAPYGFTPMCDSRKEIEGFRFWKQGYWKKYLGNLKYHISALYVVDLIRFRELAAGDMLRQHYQMLSADPGSLSNLDQDLPNHLQKMLPIYSLPQDWLWCETWCSDEALLTAKTIDLCNNPMTKEPKLDRAKRQVPEWVKYDEHVVKLNKKVEDENGIPELTDSDTEDELSEAETEVDETENPEPVGFFEDDDDMEHDEL